MPAGLGVSAVAIATLGITLALTLASNAALRAALEELVARELDHLLDADDFGGCWVPRHLDWDATRGLSLHAWGIAFDVNVRANPYGSRPQLDPRLVHVFERYGFNWGGRWREPDGMHFELGELLEPDDVPGPERPDDG